jgi:hypothetical protein
VSLLVYLSSNNGVSWTPLYNGLSQINISCVFVFGTNIFLGTDGGIFLSSNNGAMWAEVNTGLPKGSVLSLAVSRNTLYAVGLTLYRRPLVDFITSVNNQITELSTRFELAQNYPNPFNPSTTISFSLPSGSFVTLKVFDVMGREVSTIASEELQAGYHSRQWNAPQFPSGIYFYRLQAGSYTETKRLVLLR